MRNQSTRTALAVLFVVVLAGAFWALLLGPKREKADQLSKQVSTLETQVTTEQQRADIAVAAKHEFPRYYSELVLLGKAVPAEAATPSLLIQLNHISARAKTSFTSIVGGGGGDEGEVAAIAAVAGEEAQALPPIGATAGPAGLSAMPYSLQFDGNFFGIADFIEGLDAQVKTKDGVVIARGRLVTIDSFNLAPPDEDRSSLEELGATFNVTTYVTPTGQGLTAGATPSGPAATTPE